MNLFWKQAYRCLAHPVFYRCFQAAVVRRQALQRFVRDWIRPATGMKLLDVGCGPGRLLDVLPREGLEFTGIDYNPQYIEMARKRHGPRGTFVTGNAAEPWPVPDRSMHVVVLIGVLHHLSDAEARRVFSQAARVLQPGGRLVTSDPVRVSGQHWIAQLMMDRDRGKYIRTAEDYQQLAAAYFYPIEGRVEEGHLRLPYQHWLMNCALPLPNGPAQSASIPLKSTG